MAPRTMEIWIPRRLSVGVVAVYLQSPSLWVEGCQPFFFRVTTYLPFPSTIYKIESGGFQLQRQQSKQESANNNTGAGG